MNKISGKVEIYRGNEWVALDSRKKELIEQKKLYEIEDDLGILGTFEPKKPNLFIEFISQIKKSFKEKFQPHTNE